MPNLIYTAVGDDGNPSTGDTLLGDLHSIAINEQVQVGNHVMLDSDSITLHEDLAFNGEILHEPSPSKSTDEDDRNTSEEFCIVPSGLNLYQVMPSPRGPRSSINFSINELGKQLLGCAKEGDVEGVRTMMAKGAPFASDFLGTSALHLAAQYNQFSTAELLLRAGISRDARTKVEKTALHIAATEGHVAIVQLLLSYGAEVNARDMLKMTPLHWAVDRGHVEVIRVLIECGASTDLKSKFDKTPFDVAKDYSRSDLIEFMQSIEPVPQQLVNQDNDQEMEAATRSISVDNVHVPAVLHQEEVETSVLDGNNHTISEEYLNTKSSTKMPRSSSNRIPVVLEDELAQNSSTMQMLEAHGITMLPEDEGTLVESVIEKGQTVVLTDAGKLALKQEMKNLQQKLLKKISPGQAVLVPKSGSKNSTSQNFSSLPKKTIVMRQYKGNIPEKKTVEEAQRILSRAVSGICSNADESVAQHCTSIEEAEKKLAEALQAVKYHKHQARDKELEAHLYRKQIELLKRKHP